MRKKSLTNRPISSLPKKEVARLLQSDVRKFNLERQVNPDFIPDFSHTNLSDSNMAGANLFRANLKGANLKGSNLKNTDLREANLTGARLERAKLDGAELKNAQFVRSDLSKTKGLLETQLSGANLNGATLPDTTEFSGLDTVEKHIASLETTINKYVPVGLILIFGLFYGISIPAFKVLTAGPPLSLEKAFTVIPLIYGAFYLFLLTRCHDLWREQAGLPVIFKSRTLGQVHPSIFTILQYDYSVHLRAQNNWLHILQNLGTRVCIWGLCPLVYVSVWATNLRRMDGVETATHLFLLLCSLLIGAWSYLAMRKTLSLGFRIPRWQTHLEYSFIVLVFLSYLSACFYSIHFFNQAKTGQKQFHLAFEKTITPSSPPHLTILGSLT